MTDAAGIDHIYIAVTDLSRSEAFYDRVMLQVLGFRKNTFIVAGDRHIQYFNRYFGFVLRPCRLAQARSLRAGTASPLLPRGFDCGAARPA